MKKYLLSALLVLSVLATTATPASAATYDPEVERCQKIAALVRSTAGKYDREYPRKMAAFKKASQQVKQVITKAKASGKDTTKLEEVSKMLDAKIAELQAQANKVVAQLKVVKNAKCNQPGQARTEREKAQQEAQVGFQMMTEIQRYIETTVKPEITALGALNSKKPVQSPKSTVRPTQKPAAR